MNLSDYIKYNRLILGTVAKHCGTSASTILRLRDQQVTPSARVAKAIWEFIGSLFSYFSMMSIGIGAFCGYLLGYRQVSFFVIILACPAIWSLQAMFMLVFDSNIKAWNYISRTGAQRGVEWLIMAHLILHPSVVVLAIIAGRVVFAGEVELIRERGLNLSANETLHMLNVLSNHPELASAGWFATRWANMNADERALWVHHKLEKLQQIWMLGFDHDDVGGFEAYGASLPMQLAAIDSVVKVEPPSSWPSLQI
ncbi:MAG: hypothetical protein AB8B94_15635 [Hyphomicrobiales bacterium]